MPSLIQLKEYGYSVKPRANLFNASNLSQLEKPKMFWFASLCLPITLSLWHTITKMQWNPFLKICKGIWAEN